MTIVLEDDSFSSFSSSLSTLSTSQSSNYQTLVSTSNQNGNNNNNGNSSSPPSSSSIINSCQSADPSSANSPYVVFLFRSANNSTELFEERRIMLDKPCKIGRSVAKIRPEPNNAIFDCKVLSRNHALIWEENGKYFIQDTKSSNGTFLNGNRLGKSNEDSSPFELNSGDIIQFGVDVTENTKKVTHGCITVEVKLFHRAGVEAINRNSQQGNNKIDVQTQELYQLALFIQEAAMREEILNQKLTTLQNYIDQAKEKSENGWLTLIDEDRLLSRIDYLEKQLLINAKSMNEETLVNKINAIKEEKTQIENTAKMSIQKLVDEKNDLSQNYDDLKAKLESSELECKKLEEMKEESKKSLVDLADKYQELLKQIDELQQSLDESKTKYQEKCTQFDVEQIKYEQQVSDYVKIEKTLTTQIESLIAEKDFQAKRLEGIMAKFEQSKHLLELNLNGFKENDLKQMEVDKFESIESMVKQEQKDEAESNEKSCQNEEPILNDVSNNKENLNNQEDESSTGNQSKSLISKLSNELARLNEEIEQLKSQLDNESRKNLKLKEELNEIDANRVKTLEAELNEKNARLTNLELDLNEKQLLISKLLTENKYDSSNKQIIRLNKPDEMFIAKNENENINKMILNLEQAVASSNASTSFISNSNHAKLLTKNEFSEQFKLQIESIKNGINQFLSKNNEINVTNYALLQDACNKLNELDQKLALMLQNENLVNLTDAQKEQAIQGVGSGGGGVGGDVSLLDDEIKLLNKELNELREHFDGERKKLEISENLLEEVSLNFDSLNDRARVVSYFSMVPFLILLIALVIAFYPTLSTITATGI